jgi:hypothetical protein
MNTNIIKSKSFVFFLSILFCLGTSRVSIIQAAQEKYGPVPQYSGYQWIEGSVTIPTTNNWTIHSPISGKNFTFGGWGGGEYQVYHPAPVFVNSYLYIESPFDPATGLLQMIEVVAYDLKQNYDANGVPQQRGFTFIDPDIGIPGLPPPPGKWMPPPPGKFYFAGLSGTKYDAFSVEMCQVSNLPSRLAGFNVSQFTGPSTNMVYIITSPLLPAMDFTPFVFSFDYQGFSQFSDPNWQGPPDANYPYQHRWTLNITQWNPSVPSINEIDIQAAFVAPGYVKAVGPPNWGTTSFNYYFYYEAEPGHEIIAAGSFPGWVIGAGSPSVGDALVYFTWYGQRVSNVVETVAVVPEPNSFGSWDFFDPDLNKDSYINFLDLAVMADQWLECSNPGDPACGHPSVIGLGFEFDGEDTTGPARIMGLYDTYASGLDANDVIIEYQGQKVASGAALLSIIQSLPELTSGQIVTMKVARQGQPVPIIITPAAIPLPITTFKTSHGPQTTSDGQCVEVKVNGKRDCECSFWNPMGSKCVCGWETKVVIEPKTKKKTIYKRTSCTSSNGARCIGDWRVVK